MKQETVRLEAKTGNYSDSVYTDKLKKQIEFRLAVSRIHSLWLWFGSLQHSDTCKHVCTAMCYTAKDSPSTSACDQAENTSVDAGSSQHRAG